MGEVINDQNLSKRLGRRAFLVKGAGAAAAGTFMATIITMQPAGASALTSPPPVPPSGGESVIIPPEHEEKEVKKNVPNSGTLPFTGTDPKKLIALGGGAAIGGAALQVWSSGGPSENPAS